MATVKDQTVHTGHTILFKVKGVTIGRAQGIDGERSFGTEGVYEIGSIMPQEHVTNRYEGSLNIERFFVREGDLADLGLASVGEEVLKKDILTIEILDKYTCKLVRRYHGCTVVNYRETFRANAIAGENATFTYLRASSSDENLAEQQDIAGGCDGGRWAGTEGPSGNHYDDHWANNWKELG